MSQDQLSKTIGFTNRSQVCRLEAGTVDWKAVDLIKAADALGIPDDEVLAALTEILADIIRNINTPSPHAGLFYNLTDRLTVVLCNTGAAIAALQ